MEATTLLYVIIIHEFSFCCGTIKVLYLEKNLVFFFSYSHKSLSIDVRMQVSSFRGVFIFLTCTGEL